jgi:mRNA-degrading endonuclease RelE of RelBE toxin-antitoxin system
LDVFIDQDIAIFCKHLSVKDRRVVLEHIERLKDPYHVQGDVKRLRGSDDIALFRMHIARKYTILYRVFDDHVNVDILMTIEPAHKRYDRYLDSL